MQHLDPRTLETAFVPPNTPTLADLIARLRQTEDPSGSRADDRLDDQANARPALRPERRRDMVSALRRVAAALERAPQAVPADPRWLRPRLARVAPAALRISAKTWSNVLSNLRAALEHFGLARRTNYRGKELSPDWQRLWGIVLASKDPSLPAPLRRFVHFLSGQGVPPNEVGDAHADLYRAAIEAAEVSRDPERSYRAAVNGWNLAVRRLPDWPRQRLSLPSRHVRVALPLETFPETFRIAFDAYVASLERPDPFDPEGRIEALRPASVTLYRQLVHRFASILVEDGMDPEEIVDLAALTEPATVRRGLSCMLARNEGATSKSIMTTAQLLRGIARDHLRRPAEDVAVLDDLARRVVLKPTKGLTEKNRRRLRPLQDAETLRRLLRLPEALAARAEAGGATYHGALRHEQAVAIAILLHCPIRVGNLAALDVERNLQRPGDGRVFLVFGAGEVKNRHPLEFELPRRVAAMIDAHVATWRPLLSPGAPPWLFPRRDGTAPMAPGTLSNALAQRIRKEIGLEINVHLFRHLAAMLWLEANPGSYEVVRRLLGHAELSRTLDAYAGFEAGTATRLFGDLIDGRRQA